MDQVVQLQRDGTDQRGSGGASIHRRQGFVHVGVRRADRRVHARGIIGTTINHLVEGFVKASAVELPRGIRINCISPTVLAESEAYHAYFTGFTPVPAAEVARAYLRAMSSPITGRILKLHKTDS